MFRFSKQSLLAMLLSLAPITALAALGEQSYVSHLPSRGALTLVAKTTVAPLYVDPTDHKGVIRALGDLQQDIARVTGKTPTVIHQRQALGSHSVIVGTIGKSNLIDTLIRTGKLKPSAITGQWDAYHLQVVNKPLPGVERALVIAGANKRGTLYGIYDVSEQIGVSPWYYWADVPVQKKSNIYIRKNTLVQDAPKVKYRGIFLNDEAPALSNWVKQNHGDYNHAFYEKVFELLLRLKANYLWPAMWNNAFADDDPLNMILADEYGIVMGTSHHEPMMRADKEWNRHGKGPWEYSSNPKALYDFWQAGAKRNKPYESLYTMGMRGQQDEPMSEGENIELLETIVKDQRSILSDVFSDRELSDVPQLWCLYKEVQAYYEKGMRVPDDITLLWSDDNWGNIRRLPTTEERNRVGGAGVYYHFDYVGGPRSYRWLNTVPIAKVWEQMNLAYHTKADTIWIVNVGDLKPMEYPIEFFLRMAWNPENWPHTRLQEFGQLWATREFGEQYAEEIESLITGYTRHNGRRKPELMTPDTYSLLNYNEAERISNELNDLVTRAETLYNTIPTNKKNAFFQLVLYPVKASATVTQLNIAVGKNRLYAQQGRAEANHWAKEAQRLFKLDAALEAQYHALNNGKWNHFMSQPRIGYTNWNNPAGNQMPSTHQYTPGNYGDMAVAVEGYSHVWPDAGGHTLRFDQNGRNQQGFELFNRGTQPVNFKILKKPTWLKLSLEQGEIASVQKIEAAVDWQQLPEGTNLGEIVIKGNSWAKASIHISAFKPNEKRRRKARGFLDADGYIAIEAANASRGKSALGISWSEIPQHGRTQSAITPLPFNDKSFTDLSKAPYVEYDLTFFHTGEFDIHTHAAPSLPFFPNRGLRYAITLSGEEPQIVDLTQGFSGTDEAWEETVKSGVRIGTSVHKVVKAGRNTLRIYALDSGVAIQKILVNTGGLKPSYLGPEQSIRN